MTGEPPAGARTGFVEWAVAARCLPGEQVSGDASLVLERADDVLIAVVDGLGHGPEAADAARAAVEALAEHPSEPPGALLERCHERLRRTRGAALSVAVIDGRGALAWAGVGNVEARLIRAGGGAREAILLRGGIVGYRLPPLRVSTHAVAPGDVLVFATDGVRSAYADDVAAGEAPAPLADLLLARHFRGTDDALVLAARVLERGP